MKCYIPMKNEDLIAEISALPVEERVSIADKILQTLNTPDKEIEQKWLKVANSRLKELKTGKEKGRPGKDVFKNIQERYSG